MSHLKPEAAPLAHTLDQLLSCLSLSYFSLANFLQRGVYTHCMYLLTSLSFTNSPTCTKSTASLAPVPVGSRSESPSQHQDPSWLDVSLVSPAQLPFLLALCAVILLSHLPSKTSCFVLACRGPLMSPFSRHHLPGKVSSLSSQLRCHLLLTLPRQQAPFLFGPHHASAFALYGSSTFISASPLRYWAPQK